MPQAIAPHPTVPIESVEATPTTWIDSVEAFRVGTWVDMNRRREAYTEAQLIEAAETYNELAIAKKYEAPVLENHSFAAGVKGWIKPTARVENGVLIVDLHNMPLSFAADVKGGIYKKRSIGLWAPDDDYNPAPGKWGIMELSYVPIPAIWGLQDNTFSPPNEGGRYITFSSSPLFAAPNENITSPRFAMWSGGFGAIADLFQRLRDRMLTESGDIEATDAIYTPWAITEIRNMGEQMLLTAEDLRPIEMAIAQLQEQVFQLQPQPSRGFAMTTEATPETVTETAPAMPDYAAEIAELREGLKALKTENETLKADNQKLFSAAAIAKKEAEELQVNTTLDRLQEEGHISESDRPQHFAFAMSLSNEVSEEGPKFSIGDQVLSQRALYLKQLGDRPNSSRQFSAGKIDIPDSAPKAAGMTARRKTRALPTLTN